MKHQFFLSLCILFIVASTNLAFGENAAPAEEISKIVNYIPTGFSLEYPKHFELSKNTLNSDGWLFSLNSTSIQTYLDVFALPLDPELKPSDKKDIVDYIFLLNFIECQQATVNKTGYQCFNFSPLDYSTKHQGNAEFYEITFSILTKNNLGNYTNKVKTVTDIWIPDENYLISIHGTFNEDQYLENSSAYEKIIESIDLSVPHQKTLQIPIQIKVNAALWSQDLISGDEFFDQLVQMVKINSAKYEYTNDGHMPDWFKDTCQWWVDGLISDNEYYNSVNYLFEHSIIRG